MENKTKIIIGVVIAIVIGFIVPSDYWTPPISKGRSTSEASIVEKNGNVIVVRLLKGTANDKTSETNCFL